MMSSIATVGEGGRGERGEERGEGREEGEEGEGREGRGERIRLKLRKVWRNLVHVTYCTQVACVGEQIK